MAINRKDWIRQIDALSCMLTPVAIEFRRKNPRNQTSVYAMRMPISQELEEFEVCDKALAYGRFHDYIPGEVLRNCEYYTQMYEAIQNARDYRPFNDDLKPLNTEEASRFGVRVGVNNRCVPMKKRVY